MAKYKVLVIALSCLNNKIAEGNEIIEDSALPIDNIQSLIDQGFIELFDESDSKKSKVKASDIVDESDSKKK